jgi:hypothetical protein
MRRCGSVAAAIAGLVLLCGAASAKMPDAVAAQLREMAAECTQVHGEPNAGSSIEHGDLGAGLEFWAIDEGLFQCKGAESLFSGSGGSQVVVYVSTPSGPAQKAFDHGAYGLSVEQTGDHAKIWIRVGGELCGQKGNPTHADLIGCERPLTWDPDARELRFAALSEARFLGQTPPLDLPQVEISDENIPYDSGSELENPGTYVFHEYWADRRNQVDWKLPVDKRGMIYNWPFRSADGRNLMVSLLQSTTACDTLCPIRVFTAEHRKIMDIVACPDRKQHGLAPDHSSFVACGKSFPIPQVDKRTAIMENAPPDSNREAYVQVVARQESKPADAPKPVHVDSAFHNGSQVLVSEWKDGAIEITYDVPRAGLPVAQGTLLFKGTRSGAWYSGTAYIFKAGCSPAPYAVSGLKDQKKDKVVLTGVAPHRDPRSCEVNGGAANSQQSKLVFDTKFYGDE